MVNNRGGPWFGHETSFIDATVQVGSHSSVNRHLRDAVQEVTQET